MFFTLLLFAVFFVLSELLKPKPKNENARPAHLGDFKFPTATEGRVVPIIWGTVKMEGPNVIWYGNLKQKAITKKVKTGLFSSDTVTTGYRYYMGCQMALCRGPVDSLLRVWIGDKVVYSTPAVTPGNSFLISKPNLFGGNELGNGGVKGTCVFYGGTNTQAVDPYIALYQQQGGDTPAYVNTSYVIAKNFYFGNSAQIEPWAFEVRRIPNALGLGGVNSGNDANPIEVLYEILTNTDWGLGMLPSDVDTTTFTAAGTTLAGEGNGFSLILDKATEAADLIREIERQIDGFVYMDRTTGKWTVGLARGGYNVLTLPLYDESNIIETSDFARGAWEDTANEIKIDFVDRSRDYFETYAIAQDMANARTQRANVLSSPVYPGVKDRNLANKLAWRDLRVLSFPLAKVTLKVDRKAYTLNPSSVIAWSNARLGLTRLPMRVQKINFGDMADSRISLSLAQDVFANTTPAFGAPTDTGWVAQTDVLLDIPTAQRLIFEAPRAFVNRADTATGQQPRVWAGVRNQSDGAAKFTINYELADVGTATEFLVAGALSAALPRGNFVSTLDIVADLDVVEDIMDAFRDNLSLDDVGTNLFNVLFIGDTTTGEFIACQSAALFNPTTIRLTNVYRGLMDTSPKSWGSGQRLWVLVGGMSTMPQSGASGNVRALTVSGSATMGTGTATPTSVTFTTRYNRPYPPANVKVNTNLWPTAAQDTAGTVTGGDARGLRVTFDRRDFRSTNEVSSVTSEAVGLAAFPGFPTDNTTKYAIQVNKDPNGTNTTLFTTTYNAGTGQIDLPREKIVRYANGLPTRVRVIVFTQHTVSGTVYDSRENVTHDFDIADSQLATAAFLGVLNPSGSSSSFTAPSTGTYTLQLDRSMLSTGKVQAAVNGGGFGDFIGPASTSGTIALNAGDTLIVRCTEPGPTTSETLFRVVLAGSTKAFAVFLFA